MLSSDKVAEPSTFEAKDAALNINSDQVKAASEARDATPNINSGQANKESDTVQV